jgi:transglutaminase-like putative cysteine protease
MPGTTSQALSQIVADAKNRVGTGSIPLAIALHNYVRDEIQFGFTPYFDAASPDMTLKLGTGHCNPQAWLMVELFRAAGFQARFRPSTIRNDVLKGLVWTPPILSHVFTEVLVEGSWKRLDSYIADPPFRDAVVRKLAARAPKLRVRVPRIRYWRMGWNTGCVQPNRGS